MGFIDKTSITVTARLTKRGRDYLSAAMTGDLGPVENGNQKPYIITKFACGDDEIDYTQWDESQEPNLRGRVIENMPVLEQIPIDIARNEDITYYNVDERVTPTGLVMSNIPPSFVLTGTNDSIDIIPYTNQLDYEEEYEFLLEFDDSVEMTQPWLKPEAPTGLELDPEFHSVVEGFEEYTNNTSFLRHGTFGLQCNKLERFNTYETGTPDDRGIAKRYYQLYMNGEKVFGPRTLNISPILTEEEENDPTSAIPKVHWSWFVIGLEAWSDGNNLSWWRDIGNGPLGIPAMYPGQTYEFYVTAVDNTLGSGGSGASPVESDPSNTVTFTVPNYDFDHNPSPVYRFWGNTDHFYTMDESEKDDETISSDFHLPHLDYEHIDWYMYPKSINPNVDERPNDMRWPLTPLHRYYSADDKNHFYRVDSIAGDSFNHTIGETYSLNGGWGQYDTSATYLYEGIVGYVVFESITEQQAEYFNAVFDGYGKLAPLYRNYNAYLTDNLYTVRNWETYQGLAQDYGYIYQGRIAHVLVPDRQVSLNVLPWPIDAVQQSNVRAIGEQGFDWHMRDVFDGDYALVNMIDPELGWFVNGVGPGDIAESAGTNGLFSAAYINDVGAAEFFTNSPYESTSGEGMLIQDGKLNNHYEVIIENIEPSTTYVAECWVAFGGNWNGGKGIFHMKATPGWQGGGTGALPGNVIESHVSSGNWEGMLHWERKYQIVTTTEDADGTLRWFLGYQNPALYPPAYTNHIYGRGSATTGYRFITGISFWKDVSNDPLPEGYSSWADYTAGHPLVIQLQVDNEYDLYRIDAESGVELLVGQTSHADVSHIWRQMQTWNVGLFSAGDKLKLVTRNAGGPAGLLAKITHNGETYKTGDDGWTLVSPTDTNWVNKGIASNTNPWKNHIAPELEDSSWIWTQQATTGQELIWEWTKPHLEEI